MTIKKWKTLKRQVILDHPRIQLVEDTVKLPDGQEMVYLRRPPIDRHSVAILALNKAGKILLQREYRYPLNEVVWQLPGGKMDVGEDVAEAAIRELSEESGLTAKSCKTIGWFYTQNHMSDQKQYVVVCKELIKRDLPADQGEFIENHWITQKKLKDMIKNGEINNLVLLGALQLWLDFNV